MRRGPGIGMFIFFVCFFFFLYDEKKYWGRQLKTGTDTFFFCPIIVCAHVTFLKQNEYTCTYLTIAE